MIFDKIKIAFNVPGEPSAASGPPADPPSNPTDSNPEAVTTEDNWVLNHFDALNADENSEDVDPLPVEPAIGDPSLKPIGAQASITEQPLGVASVPTREVPVGQAGQVTPPVASAQAPSPSALPAGAGAPQTASPPGLKGPESAPEPARILASIAEGISQQRDAFIDKLAKETYHISDKQADDLGLTREQADFMAKQQASSHVNIVQSMTQMQSQQMPLVIAGEMERRQDNQRKEDAFFGKWPQLRGAKRDDLARVFQAVAQIHPDLKDPEQWRQKAGEMACVSLGISLQQQANGSVQPTQQQVRTPGPIVRQTSGLPHLPVGTSTAPAPVAPQLSEAERFFELLKATDAGAFEN